MSDGSCLKFNNTTQKIFGNTVRASVVVWETNDCEKGWSAEARLTVLENSNVLKVGKGSATTKQKAKDMAAKCGFEWLCSEYP
ncbi:hypothetical protein MD484_g7467, partial [Candolleomyces efflorescens]